jgi:hypothetical protein
VSPLRKATRRVERALLGAAMTVIAFVIERRVLKAIQDKSAKAEPQPEESLMEELQPEFRA